MLNKVIGLVMFTGQTVNIVGEYSTSVLRAYDFSRSSVRSPFDGNVVYQFETMETVRSTKPLPPALTPLVVFPDSRLHF